MLALCANKNGSPNCQFFKLVPPGFRAQNEKYFPLAYPEAIFDIRYFRSKPEPFYEWAKEFFPGVNYQPNDAHWFIKRLYDHQKLLRLFTQNIDGLERLTDLPDEKLVFAHGSFSTASCTL